VSAAYATENRKCDCHLLCIDQVPEELGRVNDSEKIIQVRNMGRLYENATVVLVMVAEFER
jgi:hypothetical protein